MRKAAENNQEQKNVQVYYVQAPVQAVDPMQQIQMQPMPMMAQGQMMQPMQQMDMMQQTQQMNMMQPMQQMNMMQPAVQGQMMQPMQPLNDTFVQNETDFPAQAVVYQSSQPPTQPPM